MRLLFLAPITLGVIEPARVFRPEATAPQLGLGFEVVSECTGPCASRPRPRARPYIPRRKTKSAEASIRTKRIEFRIELYKKAKGTRSSRILDRQRLRHAQAATHRAAEDLLEIVMRGYERASTLRTSNRRWKTGGELLGDVASVSSMLDRTMHHGHVLKCGSRSWRTKAITIIFSVSPSGGKPGLCSHKATACDIRVPIPARRNCSATRMPRKTSISCSGTTLTIPTSPRLRFRHSHAVSLEAMPPA